MFTFDGPLESSKSWMNRAAIIQHYNTKLKLIGFSKAQDVVDLKAALCDLENNQNEFQIGEGGTTFRFFSILLSRLSGDFKLRAHPRLLQRPQQDLILLLKQLGCDVKVTSTGMQIRSKGWNLKNKIRCNAAVSSQFVSGLLLNSWNLPDDLEIELALPVVSEDYLKMTLSLLKTCGMKIVETKTTEKWNFKILKSQIPQAEVIAAELDISSAFALIAAGAIAGSVKITNWNSQSTQPDFLFLQILDSMTIQYSVDKSTFAIQRQTAWKAISINLVNAPDLFPVLAVLCSQAEGESYLFGASQLKAKESDRLSKTFELLQLCGVPCAVDSNGLRIQGSSSKRSKSEKIIFDPDHDHRMAMAAGLLQLAGFNIEVLHPQVVQKSYPNFWNDIGVTV